MTTLQIHDGVVVDHSDEGWAAYKHWLDGTHANLLYSWVDEGSAYKIVAVDGPFYRTFSINKTDASDFEANYKTLAPAVPKSADGKPVVTTNAFPSWVVETVVGIGDDPDDGIGEGQPVLLSNDTTNDVQIEFGFNCSVYLAAGGAMFKNALYGDWVRMRVYAPAAEVTGADPANTGNCNLTAIGGGVNMITPANDDGTHDVDLDTASPIPHPAGQGYWSWDNPQTGRGTITPGTAGASMYMLLDTDQYLAQFANKIHLLGDGCLQLGIQNVLAKKILPHWVAQITLHNDAGTQDLQFAAHLKIGRKQTI